MSKTTQYFCETLSDDTIIRSMTWVSANLIDTKSYDPQHPDGLIYEVDIETLNGNWADFGEEGAKYDPLTNTVSVP